MPIEHAVGELAAALGILIRALGQHQRATSRFACRTRARRSTARSAAVSISPEPKSSASVSATCAAASALRSQCRCRGAVVERAPCRSVSATWRARSAAPAQREDEHRHRAERRRRPETRPARSSMYCQPGTKRITDAGIDARETQPTHVSGIRRRATRREQSRLDHQLPRQAARSRPAPGASRTPATARAARQQQVGDVRAGDQQQQDAAACRCR